MAALSFFSNCSESALWNLGKVAVAGVLPTREGDRKASMPRSPKGSSSVSRGGTGRYWSASAATLGWGARVGASTTGIYFLITQEAGGLISRLSAGLFASEVLSLACKTTTFPLYRSLS